MYPLRVHTDPALGLRITVLHVVGLCSQHHDGHPGESRTVSRGARISLRAPRGAHCMRCCMPPMMNNDSERWSRTTDVSPECRRPCWQLPVRMDKKSSRDDHIDEMVTIASHRVNAQTAFLILTCREPYISGLCSPFVKRYPSLTANLLTPDSQSETFDHLCLSLALQVISHPKSKHAFARHRLCPFPHQDCTSS